MKPSLKNFSFLLVGTVFGFGSLALAESTIFTDGPFDDWFEKSVEEMSAEGVITGYPDGSFGPSNSVNRAELAVILDRYTEYVLEEKMEEYFEEEMMGVLSAISQMDEFTFTSDLAMMAVVMAEAGLRELDGIPNLELSEASSLVLPEGYTGYWHQTGGESGYPLYLHYEGEILNEDVVDNYEAWYGPFYSLNPDKL